MKRLFLFLFLFLLFTSNLFAFPAEQFNSVYKIDSLGFRISENKKSFFKKFLIVAGDSNVFGDGVEGNETLPFLLGNIFSDFQVYNMGIRGGGPHDTLYQFENFKFDKYISQKKGIFVYNFFPFLYERVIGSKNYLKWTRKNSPYYVLNERNEAEYRGTFNDRYLITSFYRFINESSLLNFFIPKLPQIHRWHIKLTAAIFKKMEIAFKKEFPDSLFLVLVNNSYSDDPAYIWQNKILVQYLNEFKVKYEKIDSVKNFKLNFIFKDGHINRAGQKIESELVSKVLGKYIN